MPVRLIVLVALLALAQPPRAVDREPGSLAGEGQAAAAAGVETLVVNGLGMRFVRIPAGSFDMGSNVRKPEQPVHRVDVPSFWMGVTEVTQGQWRAVMGSNPSYFKEAGANAPVEMVSWQDAQAFISKLNALVPGRRYRLPSEAEWEYACRANSKEDPYGPVEEIGWVAENSGGTTHPVGLKRPNAFGLYDMFGNVPEWVQDTWHEDYTGAPADGSAWEGGGSPYHPLRGGGRDLPSFFVHAGLRDPYDPIHRLGLRVVLVQEVRAPSPETRPGAAGPERVFPSLAGPYLGQAPPGASPSLFAEGVVSTGGRELNAVFTPDGHEFYFTVHGEDRRWTIMRMVLENDRWSPPRPASFSGHWSDVDMFVTSDGQRLYFCSNRPLQGDVPKDFDIWVCERSGAEWGEPRNLAAPINSAFNEFYPSLTRDGTFYFQSRRPGGPGLSDIWRSRLAGGAYLEAECLPSPINSPASEGDALIAPDESYLIVSTSLVGRSRPQSADATPSVRQGTPVAAGTPAAAAPPPPPSNPPGLFFSARRADGTWSPLVSLENGINSAEAGVNCQMLSPDGRYLFFTRGGDIFWISASVIEDAKRRAHAQAR